MTRSMMLLGVCAASALVLAGCSSTTEPGDETDAQSESAAAINTDCPTSGRPVVASIGTVSYNGSAIGFCCAGCKGAWEQMAEADKEAFVASQG